LCPLAPSALAPLLVFLLACSRLERLAGARRYASFLIFSSGLALVWEAFVEHVLGYDGDVPPGPYGALGALLPMIWLYVPVAYPDAVSLGPARISEKMGRYALAAWCVAASGKMEYATIPVVLGMAAGALFWWEDSPLKLVERLDLPGPLCRAVLWTATWTVVAQEEVAFGPFSLGVPESAAGVGPLPRPLPARRVRVAADPARERAPAPVAPAPDPALVEQLVSMGFGRGAAERSMRQTGGNVERALERLLIGGGDADS